MTEQPSLHVPGRPNQQSAGNPLTVLTAALQAQTNMIGQGLELIVAALRESKSTGEHVYALKPIESDQGKGFMSFCIACSDAAQQYIHPCREFPAMPTPPSTFLTEPSNPGEPAGS